MTQDVLTEKDRMKLVDYSIEGDVKCKSQMDFSQADLEIHGFVGQQEVGHCSVDKAGHYKMAFHYGEPAPNVELRVLSAALSDQLADALTLNTKVSPMRFIVKDGSRIARQDLPVPADFISIAQWPMRIYKMHGAVYATTYEGGNPVAIEPLPAAKIEFYLIQPLLRKPLPPFPRPALLGYAYTGPDGEYQFQFRFSAKIQREWLLGLPGSGPAPDIQARIYQLTLTDGWKRIYTAPADWDIAEDFHRDYFVPATDVLQPPYVPALPATGFVFSSVGQLPIDQTRLVDGYYTSKANDPLNVSHSPFCDTLSLFGLFAAAPQVAHYRVEIASAAQDINGVWTMGPWADLMEPLANYKWNNTTHAWDYQNMGPDAVTHLYTNNDTEPPFDWAFPNLKVSWNTANRPDGYYTLRITGYDAIMAQTGVYTTPVMCVDNTAPEAALDVISPAVGDCGGLALGTDRQITFSVTAYDPAGHMASYYLYGSRGKTAAQAGATIEVDRNPATEPTWNGVYQAGTPFTVDPRPAGLADCGQLAYNFELHVQGLATDGYSAAPESQRRTVQMDLIVSE